MTARRGSALLLVSPALGGCLGADDGSSAAPPAPANGTDAPRVGAHATGGLGSAETDGAVEGRGSQPHIHD